MKNVLYCARKKLQRLVVGMFGVAVLATMLVIGCEQNLRQAVEGTVTLDDQPLPKGTIRFAPQRGTSGPTSGGDVIDGRFSIPPEGATFAGKFRVEIRASRPSGVIRHDPDEGDYELSEQFLPARYNEKSELTATVKEGELNELVFALESE